MTIDQTNVWGNPSIIFTILKNIPTLDPLVMLMNSPLFIMKEKNTIIGFVCIKKFNTIYELGTVFVYPKFRKKGYAEKLIKTATQTLDTCYLLCHPNLQLFYTKFNFHTVTNAPKTILHRAKLFNLFLAPIFGYKICVMRLQK